VAYVTLGKTSQTPGGVSARLISFDSRKPLALQARTMTAPKQPGWGLRILEVRNTAGIPEALILPPDHEAPYWTDLRQIAQHKARAIYEPITPSTK